MTTAETFKKNMKSSPAPFSAPPFFATIFGWLLSASLLVITLLAPLLTPIPLLAQTDLLNDRTGDGMVVVMGFGDSITYGVGDDTAPGVTAETDKITDGTRGYLSRVSALAGISTFNKGSPGEFLSTTGIERLPNTVAASNADTVIFMEGTNDSIILLSPGEFRRYYQKAINVIRALGRNVAVMTKPLPCCNRVSQAPIVQEYNNIVQDLALINQVKLIDLKKVWDNTCQNKNSCELYNLPNGVHPNTSGYDAIGQAVLAKLFGINIFSETGAADLENALGLPEGSVIVKPDAPVVVTE